MKYFVIFAAVVIILGVIFIGTSMRAIRRERNDEAGDAEAVDTSEYAAEHAVVDAETTALAGDARASSGTEEDDTPSGALRGQGDLAYREALRQQLQAQGADDADEPSNEAEAEQKQALSDDEYRKALRGVIHREDGDGK
ncbi:hypothetical protein [Alicyclobacillus acidoterrestris]|uniref:Uncharacterized protein n=1 Tax=Alicyclobacillus acidoterrestris (strain ATCC 49025 / DSM 3922 / CIP 106132 / NCIMB 13137 / GD3B) TaxID=1356854 RepID=T0DET6_ALIAG|nr:hypothetical protein [Alicyclobacillus acidoterrestris]EPZ48121.1 hypothetical protein N007_04515 [Alicyclobacillus acidoterrestris ATCC 49025]UNO48656.1 hypothetical protein K1I37_18665 [Alicyclobacillus acidoterrestris]